MLQQDKADDFVIATGVQYSVRQFIQWSAEDLGVTLNFEGSGVNETATVAAITGHKAPGVKVGDVVVKIDPRYFLPSEVETLLGDPSKAKVKLGWTPEISARQMCTEMIESDLKHAQRSVMLLKNGFEILISQE